MRKAARAIIIEDGKILVMYRNKYGSEYYTLVGGQVNDNESLEQALIREVHEETGLTVTAATLMFTEDHPAPYNQQYTFFCEVAPHSEVAIQDYSEEGMLNRMDGNIHTPVWVSLDGFSKLPFRTPQLHAAICQALEHGFPKQSTAL